MGSYNHKLRGALDLLDNLDLIRHLIIKLTLEQGQEYQPEKPMHSLRKSLIESLTRHQLGLEEQREHTRPIRAFGLEIF